MRNLLLNTLVAISLSTTMFAAAGGLDPSFGSGGKVTTPIGPYTDIATSVAFQTDGKIVVAGRSNTSTYVGFAVARYTPDGALDLTFGVGGKVVTAVGTSEAYAAAVAIQADGRIVVAGYVGGPYSLAVVRYNADGSLDTTFGGSGKIITAVGDSSLGFSLAIQSNGRIVVAGNSSIVGGVGSIAVVRYNVDGSLDTSFNGTGKVITSVISGKYSSANSVAIQQDGKILAAGYSENGTDNDFVLVRYNSDGSPDNTFNGTGKVVTPYETDSNDSFTSVALQPNGKILGAGTSYGGLANGIAVVRYNADGSLDTTFNITGKVVTSVDNYSSDYAASVALQSDGKAVIAGGSRGMFDYDFVAVRYNINGTLDRTFNGTGKVVTAVSPRGDRANAMAIQPDGKIVAAGQANTGSGHDFAIVRYLSTPDSIVPTNFDLDGDGRADMAVFRPSNTVWYVNRSAMGFYEQQFGVATDKITPADLDGDRKTDITVFREGVWYWIDSSTNVFEAYWFGSPGDIALPADYSGDGRDELAIYRAGQWWMQDLTRNYTRLQNFGLAGDKPVPADYDGDGRADLAVYRDGSWYIDRSTLGSVATKFGLSTDKPVVGDYDGDGRADIAVYRNGTWYLQQSTDGFRVIQFGLGTDIPVPADYDGDGKTDAAVYRDGTWYLLRSTSGFAAEHFGLANDRPIPAAYLPTT